MSGLYTMQRGWMDHPLFKDEPYTRAQAWEWMIGEASWKETKRYIGGLVIPIRRAQLSHSIRFMAEKWQWHRSKVERFLKQLKTESMIETISEHGQNIVRIVNYEAYQLKPKENETDPGTNLETASRQHRDKEEERNKENNRTSDDEATAPDKKHVEEIYHWLVNKFNSPSTFYIMAPIVSWLQWGADFDLDIKSAAERHLARGSGPPRSLTWLDDYIAASIKQRSRTMPEVSENAGNSNQNPKQNSVSKRLGALARAGTGGSPERGGLEPEGGSGEAYGAGTGCSDEGTGSVGMAALPRSP